MNNAWSREGGCVGVVCLKGLATVAVQARGGHGGHGGHSLALPGWEGFILLPRRR